MKQQLQQFFDIVSKTIEFNKSLKFPNLDGVYLATDSQTLLEIFIMRSKVYNQLGYTKLYPDTIKGFNFDTYDTHSAILYTKYQDKITGTCRLIFDIDGNLPMDKIYPLSNIRDKNIKLAELSRLMINKTTPGLGQEPKLLTKASYEVMRLNGITISAMIPQHYRFYKNFGGFEIKDRLPKYGNIEQEFLITTWEIKEVSNYFKRLILSWLFLNYRKI